MLADWLKAERYLPIQPKNMTDHMTVSHSASLFTSDDPIRRQASGHIFKQGSSLWAHGLFVYAIILCLFHQYLLEIEEEH